MLVFALLVNIAYVEPTPTAAKANKAIAKAVEVLVADRVFYQNYFGKSNWDSLPRQDKALFYLLQYGDNLLNLGEPKGVPSDK